MDKHSEHNTSIQSIGKLKIEVQASPKATKTIPSTRKRTSKFTSIEYNKDTENVYNRKKMNSLYLDQTSVELEKSVSSIVQDVKNQEFSQYDDMSEFLDMLREKKQYYG